jgi:putative ABC transport system ATP-binding protein
MTGMWSVQLRDASVRYADGTTIQLPNLELHAGDEVALIGPSGSGKTTLLHVLAGLLRPTSGEARVGRYNLLHSSLAQLEVYRAKEVGVMFQDFHLLDGYTALEQVTVALLLAGLGVREANERAKSLLERVSLGDRLGFLPRKLSTGQRQRVALARALAVKPKLLLVDEPTAHLDPTRGRDALALLREMAHESNAALLIATHDPSVIAALPRRLEVSSVHQIQPAPNEPSPNEPGSSSDAAMVMA